VRFVATLLRRGTTLSAGVWLGACSSGAPPGEQELVRGPCEMVGGWEQVTVPYRYFDVPDEPGAGVELCFPEGTRLSASQNIEHAILLSGPEVSSVLALEVRADFESARGRLEYYDRFFCDADEYSWDYFAVFGWPALEQHFEEEVEFEPGTASTAYVHVAAGHHFLTLGVSVAPAGPSALIDTAMLVGHTLQSHNDAEAIDVDAELAELTEARSQSCP